jgi:hypothetical protein
MRALLGSGGGGGGGGGRGCDGGDEDRDAGAGGETPLPNAPPTVVHVSCVCGVTDGSESVGGEESHSTGSRETAVGRLSAA